MSREAKLRQGQGMRARWLIMLAPCVVGLLLALGWHLNTTKAPTVQIASIEPSGVFDDEEVEMWLTTVNIGKTQALVKQEDRVCHKDVRVEVKVGERWVKVEEPFLGYCLVPAKTEAFRVSLKYTGVRVVKGRLAWMAERLPGPIRFRLPHTFWRWVGFVQYGARSDWHDLTVELPFQASAAPTPPRSSPTQAQDQP